MTAAKTLDRSARLLTISCCLLAGVAACNGTQAAGASNLNAGASGGVTTHQGSGGAGAGGQSGSGGSHGSGGATTGQDSGGSSAGGRGGSSAGGSTSVGGSAAGGTAGKVGGSGGGTGGASASASGAGGSGGKTTSASGGSTGSGGTSGSAGAAGSSAGSGSCTFTVISSAISSKMATVGIVEWSTSLTAPSSAQIVYTLDNAASTILNKGGTAPVDLSKSNYHTLLLGLKPSSDYTFHIEATAPDGSTCRSGDYTLPKTGTLTGAPTVTRTAGTVVSAQKAGFIVTCSGMGSSGGGFGGGSSGSSGGGAYIIDADGTVVWYASGPSQCSRARMDYEGANMWMLALNVQNSGGEMRYIAMDGQTSQNNVSGLSSAHHDFAVLPGKIAAMVWASTGTDPESNLVEHSTSGTNTTAFKIGSNLYAGGQSAMGGGSGTYHCNSILYHKDDDTYTIGDRNPNLYVKAKHDGTPVWQIGGSCTNAKAPKCASGTWQVNHGHDFDTSSGDMLIFNNGSSGTSHVFELKLTETSSSMAITTVKDFTSGSLSSSTLGDVQRLPGGNTLITFSNAGQMIEVDSSWATVQTIKGSFGYADWRETLYGAPER